MLHAKHGTLLCNFFTKQYFFLNFNPVYVFMWESRRTENGSSSNRQIKHRTTFHLYWIGHVWTLLDQTTQKRSEKICHYIYLSAESCWKMRFIARQGNIYLIRCDMVPILLGPNLSYKRHFQKWTMNKLSHFLQKLGADWIT